MSVPVLNTGWFSKAAITFKNYIVFLPLICVYSFIIKFPFSIIVILFHSVSLSKNLLTVDHDPKILNGKFQR